MLITERHWIELTERYIVWMLAGGAKPGTIRTRAYYLSVLAATHRLRLAEGLDAEDLAMVIAQERWKPETKKSARATIRALYGWMWITNRIPRDPSLALPPVRVPRAIPRPVPLATFAEAMARADRRVRLILLLGRFGGLRREEVSQVHTRDIDGRWLVVVGKGGHVRRVPLHPVLLAELATVPDGWLFPSPDGGHLTPGHVGKLASASLPDGWTLHTCRHRAGTSMYAVKKDIRAVQMILGHASVRTTQLYTQVEDQDLIDTVTGVAS